MATKVPDIDKVADVVDSSFLNDTVDKSEADDTLKTIRGKVKLLIQKRGVTKRRVTIHINQTNDYLQSNADNIDASVVDAKLQKIEKNLIIIDDLTQDIMDVYHEHKDIEGVRVFLIFQIS